MTLYLTSENKIIKTETKSIDLLNGEKLEIPMIMEDYDADVRIEQLKRDIIAYTGVVQDATAKKLEAETELAGIEGLMK